MTAMDDFVATLPPTACQDREDDLYDAVTNAGMLVPIEWADIVTQANGHTGTITVMTDAVKVGDPDDWTDNFRITVTQVTAQMIADYFECVLPTAKISDLVHAQANVVLRAIPQGAWVSDGTMSDSNRMLEYSRKVDALLPAGATGIIDTVGKDWVNTNRLVGQPDKEANYGWHDPSAQYQAATAVGGKVWQPLSTVHNTSHTDYSQSVRLVKRMMIVDGKPMDIEDVARDPELCVLVSSEGVMQSLRHPAVPATSTGTPAVPTAGVYLNLGEAVLAAAKRDLGMKETSYNNSPRILEYLKPFGLKPPQNWCAVAVATWLTEGCKAMGIDKPIPGSPGAQATMSQFKQAGGMWVDRKDLKPEDLQPGCVPVWRRTGGEPWWGHIGVIESHDFENGTFSTIEGNAGPRGVEVYHNKARRIDDPLLFGVGQIDHLAVRQLPPVTDIDVVPDDPEPVHDDSDPIEHDAERLFDQWLGLPYLANPTSGWNVSEVETLEINATGLDISSLQQPSKLHWDTIAKNHEFVIARSTYGKKADRHFRRYSTECSERGIIFGAYHFVRQHEEWGAQLDAVCEQLDAVQLGPGDIVPTLDIEQNVRYDGEVDPSRLMLVVEKMAEVLIDRYGAVMLYTNPSMYHILGKPSLFNEQPVWVSHYGVSKPRWHNDDWWIWQSAGNYRGPEYGTGGKWDLLDLNHAKKLPLIA